MAATAKIRMVVECEGLGPGVTDLSKLFTDSNTPDKYRKHEAVISTTATLLSTLTNIPSAEVLGLGIIARDGDVYMNTISTNISTAGGLIGDGHANLYTYSPGNSCVIALKGGDADTAITMLVWGAAT